MQRREFLRVSAAGAALAATPRRQGPAVSTEVKPRKSRIKHSVCRWCYGKIPLDDLCKAVAEMGGSSVELLDEPEWGIPAKHGLVSPRT